MKKLLITTILLTTILVPGISLAGLNDNLSVYLPLDRRDIMGTTKYIDRSSHNCTGTSSNLGNLATSSVPAKQGEGTLFVGSTGQVINMPVSCATGNAGTIMGWFNLKNSAAQATIFSSSGTSDTAHTMFLFTIASTTSCGTPGVCLGFSTNNGNPANSLYFDRNTTNISLNAWHFFAVTGDNSTYHFYLDGVEKTVTNMGGSNNGLWFGGITGLANFQLGLLTRNSIVTPFNGLIDEFRVFNTALPPQSILMFYKLGLTTDD